MRPLLKTLIFIALFLPAAAGILVSVYLLARTGPAAPSRSAPVLSTSYTEDQQRWLAQISKGEETLRSLRIYRELNSDDTHIHRNTLRAYEALLASSPPEYWEHYEAAEQLRREHAELHAADYYQLSRELENEALDQQTRGELERAHSTYRRAANLQQRINAEFPDSSYTNPMRSVTLVQSARKLEAEPLHRRSMLREQEAEFEASVGNLQGALPKMKEALDLHEQLLRQFMDVPQASMRRLSHLEARMLALRTRTFHQRIEAHLEAAETAALTADYEAAFGSLNQAWQLQLELNRRFPDSVYASVQKAREIQVEIEDLKSSQDLQDLLRQRAKIRQALADRRVHEARMFVSTLREVSKNLLESYPLSRENFELLDFELTYLDWVGQELERIQDWVYDTLRPLPGSSGAFLSAAETPQWVYALVSGNNPSAVRDNQLPVERVTLVESEEFCRRLGWILGLTVSLPSLEQYRQTAEIEIGALRREHFWCLENSGGQPRPFAEDSVSPLGFQDLLGNLAEWIRDGDGMTWGGHFQLPCDELSLTTQLRFDPRARHRLVGFRFVVQRADPSSPTLLPQTNTTQSFR